MLLPGRRVATKNEDIKGAEITYDSATLVKLHELFNSFDTDNSGKLSPDEVKSIFTTYKLNNYPALIISLAYTLANKDKDDGLNFDEALACLKNFSFKGF